MRRRAAIAALAALAGCSRGAIDRVHIEGESAVSESLLRQHASACIDVEECVTLILDYYYDHGYVEVQMDSRQSRLQSLMGSGTVTVVEGPQFRFGTIEVVETGVHPDDGLDDPAALAALASPLKPGEIFSRKALREVIQAIYERYRRAGFLAANVMPLTTVELQGKDTISIRLEIDRQHTFASPTPAPP